ncbi:glycoside hydrolase family 36 protein [Enterococcus sp. LJL90]
MKKIYEYSVGKLNLALGITEENKIRLLHYSVLPYDSSQEKEVELLAASHLVELQITGYNQPLHKGNKLANTYVGRELEFVSLVEEKDKLIITQSYLDRKIQLKTITTLILNNESDAVTWQTEIFNTGKNNFGIEYISSVNVTAVNAGPLFQSYERQELYLPHNAWTGELQWQTATLKDFGLDFQLDGEKLQDSTKTISITNNSSWSCAQYNPSGLLINRDLGMSTFWQINTNGEWHWELTDCGLGKYLALRIFGPTEPTNHWWVELKPHASFATVEVLCGNTSGGFEEVVEKMTNYRRKIRKKSPDNENCPVIFNDYMNCLMGDPTTEKEIPLINRAAEIGCEYYVIDCGWYSDGYWWDNVGEWKESRKRFPNGIIELTNLIREKGMIPGLWLEIEVMGINSQLANGLPDDWFFCRHGKRVRDHSRYHLDFRNPAVRNYASSIIQRLIHDYGIGYIKMDYNITAGIGSDFQTDSFSNALLEHNRCYLTWIDEIFTTYPDLIIENCGSGGMRHDYQMLRRHSIQSITDQTNYLRNGAIAAVCASAVTPEQSAIWSYPLQNADSEEVIFNMVNTLLFRVHQSGHLAELNPENLALVKEGLETYKSFRKKIATGIPFWPSGIPHIDDDWFSFGIKTDEGNYLAVWRTESTKKQFSIQLPMTIKSVEQVYPKQDMEVSFSFSTSRLLVDFPKNKMARLFKIN